MVNLLPERLKELRIMANLSQKELGDKMGLTQTAIAKWEAGSRSPDVEYIIKICEYFKCSADFLIGLSD